MTTNGKAPRQRGIAWERAVVRWLTERGFEASRIRAGWHDDRGDIDWIDGWVVEAKACRTWEGSKWLDQATDHGRRRGLVIAKRFGRPVEDAYVIMRLEDYALLVRSQE